MSGALQAGRIDAVVCETQWDSEAHRLLCGFGLRSAAARDERTVDEHRLCPPAVALVAASTARRPPTARFEPVARCWVCDGAALQPLLPLPHGFQRVRRTGSGSASSTPASMSGSSDARRAGSGSRKRCPRCRISSIGCTTSAGRRRGSQQEFAATYKDLIFDEILNELARRVPPARRRLLDVGAHAGRFMHLAQARGWTVEGIELNPRTAAYAAARTGAPVHRVNAHTLALDGHRYDAVVLTDVLEHIPEPGRLLAALAGLLDPGGVVAVKVPNGSAQWTKERWLARLTTPSRVARGKPRARQSVHARIADARARTRRDSHAAGSRPPRPNCRRSRAFAASSIARSGADCSRPPRCPERFTRRSPCTSRRTRRRRRLGRKTRDEPHATSHGRGRFRIRAVRARADHRHWSGAADARSSRHADLGPVARDRGIAVLCGDGGPWRPRRAAVAPGGSRRPAGPQRHAAAALERRRRRRADRRRIRAARARRCGACCRLRCT